MDDSFLGTEYIFLIANLKNYAIFLALKKFGIIKENFYSKIKSPTGYEKIKAQKSDRTGRLIFWDKKHFERGIFKMVPLVRIGLTTSPLPRERSTTEPQRHK